jgi:hypothetical protein
MKKIIAYSAFLLVLISVLAGCYYDEVVVFEGLPQNVSLKNDVQPIFTQNCTTTGCHDQVPAHNPSLVTDNAYNGLINGQYINTVLPSESQLYLQVSSGNMPPSGALTSNELKIILAWITEGAKNN